MVAAIAPPGPALLALGRLDIATYTMAGSPRALYEPHRPCPARARAPARVVLGMAGGPASRSARTLAAVLAGLRTTADAASGEWWQRALPEERVVLAERSGHRTLAATVRRMGLVPQDRLLDTDPGPDRTTEEIRP